MPLYFQPTQDYKQPYNAVGARIGQAFGDQRDALMREARTRGVSGDFGYMLNSPESGVRAGNEADFAMAQGGTQSQDILRERQRQQEVLMDRLQFENADAINRRLADNQLRAGAIAGVIGGAKAGAGAYAQSGQTGSMSQQYNGTNGPYGGAMHRRTSLSMTPQYGGGY